MSALTRECLACHRQLPADMFTYGQRRTHFCQDCRDSRAVTDLHRLQAKRLSANAWRQRHSPEPRTPLTPQERRERNREYMRRRRANGNPWYTPARLRAA